MKSTITLVRQILTESEVELPTVGLQVSSLMAFMFALDYVCKNEAGTAFVYKGTDKLFPKELSWKSAVNLHNAGFVKIENGKYKVPDSYSIYHRDWGFTLDWAKQSSPLEKLYLQWNKKKHHWQVSTNIVKFKEDYFDE